ncbi:MAG: hypothetical protein AAFR55_01720 [Pseudomonadota bacterium]
MITVEGLLFAALGFLVAGVVTVLMAPLYWNRAVRLTTADLKSRMPLTENQIAADRGLLKAEHAITVNKLENQLATLTTTWSSARVEVNRRDARIAALESLVAEREAELATNENARRVLERTIMDRVPDVERHLRDARESLVERDDELDALRHQATKAFRALDEAMQINEQQREDITRLREQIETRREADEAEAARLAHLADRAPDEAGHVAALELSELRQKNRSQAALISRLQRMLGDGARGVGADASAGSAASARGQEAVTSETPDSDETLLKLEADVARMAGQIEDRDREIRALKADVAAYEASADAAMATTSTADGAAARGDGARDPRVSALETRLEAERARAAADRDDGEATIRRLRSELAAANDRLARQAATFQNEYRRLGGDRGRSAASSERRTVVASRTVEQADAPADTRASLVKRIGERLAVVDAKAGATDRAPATDPGDRPPSRQHAANGGVRPRVTDRGEDARRQTASARKSGLGTLGAALSSRLSASDANTPPAKDGGPSGAEPDGASGGGPADPAVGHVGPPPVPGGASAAVQVDQRDAAHDRRATSKLNGQAGSREASKPMTIDQRSAAADGPDATPDASVATKGAGRSSSAAPAVPPTQPDAADVPDAVRAETSAEAEARPSRIRRKSLLERISDLDDPVSG